MESQSGPKIRREGAQSESALTRPQEQQSSSPLPSTSGDLQQLSDDERLAQEFGRALEENSSRGPPALQPSSSPEIKQPIPTRTSNLDIGRLESQSEEAAFASPAQHPDSESDEAQENEEAVEEGYEEEEETSARREKNRLRRQTMAAVQTPTPNGRDLISDDASPQLDGPDDEGDLFGDEDEEAEQQDEHTRRIDDEDLDSGDDEGRTDRVAQTVEDDEEEAEYQEQRSMNVNFARIPPPVGDEMYLLNMPPFLGLNHLGFHPSTYQLPTKPHDDRTDTATTPTTTKFSAYDTAMSTVYWRRDPKNASNLQSNSRIIRWSDGSLTLQLASDPTKQYSLTTTPLHQNYNTKNNTLTSSKTTSSAPYDPTKDSNNYLVAPHGTVGFDFQITRPLDAALKVNPTADQDKAAILRLEQSLKKNASTFDPFANVKTIRVDPEKAKREAEKAEKDIAAAARKQANARDRVDVRKERVLGRSGFGRGGLSVAGLEDDDGMPTTRTRTANPKGARRPKRNRRGSIYSDDEDENMPRGRTREDEYDREDDFVAASDEELETYEDDGELPEDASDEDAEGEIDDEPAAAAAPVRERERLHGGGRQREGTPKRPAEDDADAGVRGSPQARKKRRVIDDEDDE